MKVLMRLHEIEMNKQDKSLEMHFTDMQLEIICMAMETQKDR